MVLCTSVSKTLKKQSLHICCPVFGRLIIAFAFWQRAQLFGAILDDYHWQHFRQQVECQVKPNQIKRSQDDGSYGPVSRFEVTELCRAVRAFYPPFHNLSFAATTMPKELRKRGRRHKKSSAGDKTHTQEHEVLDEGPSSGPSWIVPREDSNSKQFNPEAPFGYVDPELKAYFKTVDDQLKEWQQNQKYAEGEEDVDPNESTTS